MSGSRLRRLDRPAVRWAALAMVAALVLAGLLAVFLPSTPQHDAALLERPVTVKRALSTTAALFGDRVDAEVDVYTDDRVVDPASVRVRTGFAPYRAIAKRVERSGQDGLSLLRTRVTLDCLTRECLPPRRAGRAVRFAPLTVTYTQGGRQRSLEVPWGPLQVLSRLPDDATANVGVIDTAPPLDPGLGLSPGLVRGILFGAVAVLGLSGAALVVTGLWPSPFAARRRRPVTPLEQSLLDVEAAAAIDDETRRRRALDELATRLGELPSPSLEARTRSLAWGEARPEPQTIAHLTDDVRASVNGGVRR